MKLTPSETIWFNGELVPWDQAQVHVLSHGLHYGSSVFEGLRAYPGQRGPAVLGLAAHVDRLFESCKIVDLPIPYDEQAIEEAILATVRASALEACYIRPLVFRGYGALGVWPDDSPVEVAIACFPWNDPAKAAALEKGISVGVSSWRRMAPDTHPALAKVAGNYVNSALIVQEARRHGYADGLALDVEGYVAEGSGQNLFLAQDGKLWTPPIGASILGGITRRCVLQLAQDQDIPIVEQRIPREMLYTADEAFLTGTVAELTPVVAIDGKPVGRGQRGPVTQTLQRRFFGVVRGEQEDRWGWLTPVLARKS
jgi:branched-chain amino acid aminotransferase